MYHKHKRIRQGFTLAETLITIAVIAVVAVLTIPNLIYGYDEKQLSTRWRKQFNVAANSAKQIYANNETINFSTPPALKEDFDEVIPFLKEGTWASLSGLDYKYYGNSSTNPTSGWLYPAGLTRDGSLWGFNVISSDCTGIVGGLNNVCAEIIIDTNGTKLPNQYGRDLFFIHITGVNRNYNVYPYGSQDDGYSCASLSLEELTSKGCSAQKLME